MALTFKLGKKVLHKIYDSVSTIIKGCMSVKLFLNPFMHSTSIVIKAIHTKAK